MNQTRSAWASGMKKAGHPVVLGGWHETQSSVFHKQKKKLTWGGAEEEGKWRGSGLPGGSPCPMRNRSDRRQWLHTLQADLKTSNVPWGSARVRSSKSPWGPAPQASSTGTPSRSRSHLLISLRVQIHPLYNTHLHLAQQGVPEASSQNLTRWNVEGEQIPAPKPSPKAPSKAGEQGNSLGNHTPPN